MAPSTHRQYYGHFPYKGLVEHVVVETFGSVITRILVYTQEHGCGKSCWFTLEQFDPEAHPHVDQTHRYDQSNRLHFKALFLVFDVLFNKPGDRPEREGLWHASVRQDWPQDERLSAE